MSQRFAHPEKVYWNLKRALVERHMYVTDLAKLIGCPENYLSHIISGLFTPGKYRKPIAQVLDYDEDWLFQRENLSDISKHKIGD